MIRLAGCLDELFAVCTVMLFAYVTANVTFDHCRHSITCALSGLRIGEIDYTNWKRAQMLTRILSTHFAWSRFLFPWIAGWSTTGIQPHDSIQRCLLNRDSDQWNFFWKWAWSFSQAARVSHEQSISNPSQNSDVRHAKRCRSRFLSHTWGIGNSVKSFSLSIFTSQISELDLWIRWLQAKEHISHDAGHCLSILDTLIEDVSKCSVLKRLVSRIKCWWCRWGFCLDCITYVPRQTTLPYFITILFLQRTRGTAWGTDRTNCVEIRGILSIRISSPSRCTTERFWNLDFSALRHELRPDVQFAVNEPSIRISIEYYAQCDV